MADPIREALDDLFSELANRRPFALDALQLEVVPLKHTGPELELLRAADDADRLWWVEAAAEQGVPADLMRHTEPRSGYAIALMEGEP